MKTSDLVRIMASQHGHWYVKRGYGGFICEQCSWWMSASEKESGSYLHLHWDCGPSGNDWSALHEGGPDGVQQCLHAQWLLFQDGERP